METGFRQSLGLSSMTEVDHRNNKVAGPVLALTTSILLRPETRSISSP